MSWRLKVVLPIFVLLILAIPLLMARFFTFYEEALWENQRLKGELLMADVKDEVTQQMLAHEGLKEIRDTLEQLQRSHPFTSLSLHDAAGRAVRSIGPVTAHPVVRENQAIIRHGAEGTMLDLTLWLKNGEACHTCHGTEKRFIGYLQGTYSLESADRMLRTAKLHTFLFVLVTVFSVFILVYAILDRLVTRPVHGLMSALKRVREGDLGTTFDLDRKDELGIMATQFNEMVKSLREAREELNQRHASDMARAEQLATVGEIAAGLAHEVKNPLAGISSALDVIMREMGPDSPYNVVMGQIQEETRRIAAIINQLLDYARPKKMRMQRVSISDLLADIRVIFDPLCAKRRVTFRVEGGDEAGSIHADPDHLKQVLLNLLTNALQAVDSDGTVRLSVCVDEQVEILVEDDGCGMDAETLSRIFQPFFTTKTAGTGLGLAIASRIVKQMGGVISVDSSPGAGTRFAVRLPVGEDS